MAFGIAASTRSLRPSSAILGFEDCRLATYHVKRLPS